MNPLDGQATIESLTNDLGFVWGNEPTFSFIFRRNTGDILFTTEGTKLVFENQFIEFAESSTGELQPVWTGETIHGLRLGTTSRRPSTLLTWVIQSISETSKYTSQTEHITNRTKSNIYGSTPLLLGD
jgi:hypothetical protein